MKMIFVLLICFLSGCASYYGEDWTKTDTTMQSIYTILHIQDWNQTLQLVDDPIYYEMNPIMGKYPSRSDVNLYMGGTLLLNTIVAPALKPKYRRIFQLFSIGVETNCVTNNFIIGLSGEI